MSHVNCHLSPTATAKDPPPSYSPTMHSRLVGQDRTQKPKYFVNPTNDKNYKKKKLLY